MERSVNKTLSYHIHMVSFPGYEDKQVAGPTKCLCTLRDPQLTQRHDHVLQEEDVSTWPMDQLQYIHQRRLEGLLVLSDLRQPHLITRILLAFEL
jgi:hypothetical protein